MPGSALPWRFTARRRVQAMPKALAPLAGQALAVALVKHGNTAVERHGNALRAGLSAPLDGVASLAKDYAIAGGTRLARGADKPTEYDIYTLKEH